MPQFTAPQADMSCEPQQQSTVGHALLYIRGLKVRNEDRRIGNGQWPIDMCHPAWVGVLSLLTILSESEFPRSRKATNQAMPQRGCLDI